MKYGWSNEYLKDKIDTLEKLSQIYSGDEKMQIIQDIAVLEAMMEEDTFQDNKLSFRYFLDELEMYEEFSFFKYDLELFSNVLNDMPSFYRKVPYINLTDDDKFSLVYDFYHDMVNKDLFKLFYQSFLQRKKHVSFTKLGEFGDFNGKCFYLRSLDESFIKVNRLSTMHDIITLVHEYGHDIHYKINYFQQLFSAPFLEIVSIFMELLSYQYFAKFPELVDGVNIIEYIQFDYLKDPTNVSVLKTDLIEDIDIESIKNKRVLESILRNRFGVSKKYVEKLMICSIEYLPYMISTLVAIELLDLYNRDKDKAFYVLKEILNVEDTNAIVIYNKMLELGIELNSHTQEYQEKIIRQLQKPKLSRL